MNSFAPGGLPRRRFLKQLSYGSAIAAAAGTTMLATRRFFREHETAAALEKNPFAYEVPSDRNSDSSLLGYRQAARFSVPRADARRIACGPED